MPEMGTTRDIDSVFDRRRLRPDASVMFATEFIIPPEGAQEAVLFFYAVRPFGFSGSPAVFGRLMRGVKWLHSQFAPDNISRSRGAARNFHSDVFADDGMVVDAIVGTREEPIALKWGRECSPNVGIRRNYREKSQVIWEMWGELVLLGYHIGPGCRSHTITRYQVSRRA